MNIFSMFRRKPANPAQEKSAARKGFETGYSAAVSELGRGGYDGGRRDRFSYDWNPGTQSPVSMGRLNGRLLRERAYDLVENNPYAAVAINAYIANVIECGIEAHRNEVWEKEWNRWGGTSYHGEISCDLARIQTWPEQQAAWLRDVLVGGGCLTHWVDVPRRSQRVPLALEFKGEDWFDELKDSFSAANNRKTANRVVQGIEIDQATGRHIAYHVYRYHPSDELFDPADTIRISAQNAKYSSLPERRGQLRGVSKLRSAIMHLYSLGYYLDNELEASKLKSSFAIIMKRSPGWQGEGQLNSESCLTDFNGNPITEYQRGMQADLGPEGDIKAVGPNVPPSDSMAWNRLIQRSISCGLDLSFEAMYRDFSDSNFSASRQVLSQDKKRYLRLQWKVVNDLCSPTMRRFDDAAVGAMVNGFPSHEEWEATRDDVYDDEHDFQPPTWESPNPREDAMANDVAIKNRTKSRAQVIRESGHRPKKVLAEIKAEMDQMRADETLPTDEAAAESADMADTAEPEAPNAPQPKSKKGARP